MDLSSLLHPSQCSVEQRFGSKAQCLIDLARRAAAATGSDPKAAADALLHREALGSTGLGNGIALPHARLPALAKPFCLLTRLREALAFDAVDERPVDLLCLVLLPSGASSEQLNVLACIARRLRDEAALAAMRKARDSKALYEAATGVKGLEPAR